MTELRNALDDPTVVGRITEILQRQWDPAGAVRDALGGGDLFYREQAIRVTGMLAAEARETEVQRYLRQVEQQALPATLHPMEARHAIAVALWRAARGLPT
jgi:hypothetical protein